MDTTNLTHRIGKMIAMMAFSLSPLFIPIDCQAQNKLPGKIHIGLIYPISTNGTHAPSDTNNLSLHLLAGVSASEQGATFAGLANVVRNNSRGPQFAGFGNINRGNLDGAQFAGFINTAKTVNGAQFAGFMNAAAAVNGSQFAGFMNYASRSVSVSQIAGFINKAADVDGAQVAGFINIARKVKGAQIAGFINIADSSDYPIGIINIIRNGEKSIGISLDENLTTVLSFRSGGKKLYGILGLGYNFRNDKEVYAMEAGLGAHFFQSNTFRLNTEATAGSIDSFKSGDYFKSSLKVLPAVRIGKIELFGGPSLNFISTNTQEGRELYTHFIKTWQNHHGGDFKALYLGYGAGIQLLL